MSGDNYYQGSVRFNPPPNFAHLTKNPSEYQALSSFVDDSGQWEGLKEPKPAKEDGLREPDMVRRPPHYAALSPEPLDILLKWKLGFAEANAVKYIVRAGRKGGPEKRREDLEKAIYYLQRLIESEE